MSGKNTHIYFFSTFGSKQTSLNGKNSKKPENFQKPKSCRQTFTVLVDHRNPPQHWPLKQTWIKLFFTWYRFPSNLVKTHFEMDPNSTFSIFWRPNHVVLEVLGQLYQFRHGWVVKLIVWVEPYSLHFREILLKFQTVTSRKIQFKFFY